MQSMILAAGFGTRLQPYTHILPKPLFPVINRPLLLILLKMLQQNGCSNAVVNCHHLAGQIQGLLEGMAGVVTQYEPEILGTGGSLRQSLHRFSDRPILVMNGDLYHQVDINALYQYHLLSGNKVTMAVHDYPRFNNLMVQQDRVVSFGVGEKQADRCLAFTGIQVVNPEIIEMIPAGVFFHIIDLYKKLAIRKEIGVFRVDGSYWRDIGTPQDYLRLHQDLITDPACDFQVDEIGDGLLCVAKSAQLGKGVKVDDWACIGEGAVIGEGVRMIRSVVWNNAVVPAGSVCEDCIITA